jgi:hypothetical protein
MQTSRTRQYDQSCSDRHWLNAFPDGAGGFFAFDKGCWDRRGHGVQNSFANLGRRIAFGWESNGICEFVVQNAM